MCIRDRASTARSDSAGNLLAIRSRKEAHPADGGRVSRTQFRHSDGRASQSSTRDLRVEIGRIHPKLSAGARADCAASQGLCAARLVASSWKLNFELSLGESAEYRPNPSGTSDLSLIHISEPTRLG